MSGRGGGDVKGEWLLWKIDWWVNDEEIWRRDVEGMI